MKKPIILCVDDEKAILDSLKTQLKSAFGALRARPAISGSMLRRTSSFGPGRLTMRVSPSTPTAMRTPSLTCLPWPFSKRHR